MFVQTLNKQKDNSGIHDGEGRNRAMRLYADPLQNSLETHKQTRFFNKTVYDKSIQIFLTGDSCRKRIITHSLVMHKDNDKLSQQRN